MRECGEYGERGQNAGNKGGNAGNQGANAGNQGGNVGNQSVIVWYAGGNVGNQNGNAGNKIKIEKTKVYKIQFSLCWNWKTKRN